MWIDVTETFSEERKHYNGVYLEFSNIYVDGKYDIDDVDDDSVIMEVCYYSSGTKPYEIYFTFGKMYGIIYTNKNEGPALVEKVKDELVNEYIKNKEPSSSFINTFCEKYNVCIPNDLFFNFDSLFNL